jgi:hypothetical protein
MASGLCALNEIGPGLRAIDLELIFSLSGVDNPGHERLCGSGLYARGMG